MKPSLKVNSSKAIASLALLFCMPAWSNAISYWRCEGSSTVRSRDARYPAFAYMNFIETINERGRREIHKIKGEIFVNVSEQGEVVDARRNFDYHAKFAVDRLVESSYLSKRYLNHSQFRDLDTNDVRGRDSGGMWGHWYLQKSPEPSAALTATYVFRAGDHLGGSLDFTCRK